MFGKVDNEQLQKDCDAVMNAALLGKSKRWGFDFSKGVPMDEHEDMSWEVVKESPISPIMSRETYIRREKCVSEEVAPTENVDVVRPEEKKATRSTKKQKPLHLEAAVRQAKKTKQTTLTFASRKKANVVVKKMVR